MSFIVQAKSDPKAFAKGAFQGTIEADRVVLTQRKNVVAIPVGSNATYVGSNKIDVTLPEARVEFTVAKFGSYQNRLARDLAEFLSGNGDAPDPSQYKMEWYFYLVSVLPIGIPILTLGGAIPAVIGVALCSGCFSVCQKEEWPVAQRLAVAMAIVIAGYVMFGSVVMMWLQKLNG